MPFVQNIFDNRDYSYIGIMETLKIEILNPKAKNIIKNLADLNLISIKDKVSPKLFSDMLSKLRENNDSIPSSEEISREVEKVRVKRYSK